MADVARLLEIMAQLRDPRLGCPWDLAQDSASIAPYTLEEAYEVDDAIRRADMPGLCDELGDLLLQVVFHAQMAEEAGAFDFADVVEAICAKLVRRHPHVFGDAEIHTAEEQTRSWEAIKAAERAAKPGAPVNALEAVPLALPALTRAAKLQRRAGRAGHAALLPKAAAAADEEQLGEQLFELVASACRAGIDPERALRAANQHFLARVRAQDEVGKG